MDYYFSSKKQLKKWAAYGQKQLKSQYIILILWEFLYRDRAGDRVEGGGICINMCKVHLMDYYLSSKKCLKSEALSASMRHFIWKLQKRLTFEALLNFHLFHHAYK